ncbi:MAG: glycosyltransferase [Phycicoccus sp.]|nr:glycosyltransferase [Phycicoccus sp.]
MTDRASRRGGVAVGLTAVYGIAYAVRFALAARALRAHPPAPAVTPPGRVSVLQPIRSGDPQLEDMLSENAIANPDAELRWLVDEDDPVAQEICARLAARHGQVRVDLMPPVPQGANPKVYKLARALTECRELVAVLDDDTVLPEGALGAAVGELSRGDLVTGIPVYRRGATLWSRLVAGFVNGNALLTYLPMAQICPPVTINGMFSLTRRDELQALGGFAAIERGLCDDYELAQLYRRAGLRIVQSAVTHPLATTVPDAHRYVALQRRWLLFARRLLSEQRDPRLIGLVVVPSVLPLASVVIGGGSPVAIAALLTTMTIKNAAALALVSRVTGATSPPVAVAEGVLAELLTPVHLISSLVRPHRLQWRDRPIDVSDGTIHYG